MLRNKSGLAKSKWLMLVVLVLVLSVASGCGKDKKPAAGSPEEVIATYKDGGKITRGEFDKLLGFNRLLYPEYKQFESDPAYQQSMLEQYVMLKVLSGRASEDVKKEADKQVTEQLTQIKTFLGSQEGGLEKKLKDEKLEEKDVENLIRLSIYSTAQFEKQITDEEVKAAYDKNLKENPNAYDLATVRHVLVATMDPATGKETRTKEEALKRAKEVQAKLKSGGDFDAIAKEFSDDPGSKEKGGKYENENVNKWMEGFKKAAIELPVNTISDPVETEVGYHVMKVEERKKQTVEEAKPELVSLLVQPKMQDFVEKELPSLIETNTLPKPTATPAPSASPQAPATSPEAPAASPSASPEAPAASPSASPAAK
ncbi:peptidylprolyl isomerase [Paenibacillus sp. FJAT-26967]|uniref:peptidylprolyl isomerase n=1 Tax=Paenibacillus sp. FJAT-26967 TaxID=1729690 RepID=UPI000837D050|nr:peptidylprolyl isomerase [Paenibacillus sp. FJAT-26967]